MQPVIRKRPSTFWMSAVALAALIVTMIVGQATAAPPGPPGGLAVSEQNVDADGNIRVHEQGIVPVTDNEASLSVDDGDGVLSVDDAGGSVTVDGVVSLTDPVAVNDGGGALTVDGTVNIADPVTVDDGDGSLTVDGAVAVAGPVTVQGAVAVTNATESLTVDAPTFSTRGAWGESTPPASLGAIDRITTVSLYTTNHPSAIRFLAGGDTVAIFFAQPGAPVNLALPHPLAVDSFTLECQSTSLCEGGFSVSGFNSGA